MRWLARKVFVAKTDDPSLISRTHSSRDAIVL